MSAHVVGVNDHYPRDKGEALTAVGLLSRFLLGQDPADDTNNMTKHADLFGKTPPVWDPDGFGCDMYYWFHGAYAMYRMGGQYWRGWNTAMKRTILESQRVDRDRKGSWDPVGPWGHAGGRVYSTSMMALCLEVYFRHSRSRR